MKLTDIKNGNLSAEWAEKGYELPKFDGEAVKAKTHAEPTWVHFGAGNIFRAFPAAILNDALNSGKYDRASSWPRASTTRSSTRLTSPTTT